MIAIFPCLTGATMPCNYGGNAMTESYLFGPGRPCLQGRIDIRDTLSSLTFFIDNREYARARELFTEDAVMDYSRLRPGSSPTRTAKDFLDEGDVVDRKSTRLHSSH